MKRMILQSNEDWRTDTDDAMINAFRQIMADSIDEQDDPYVGIFWYDPNKDELFGVRSTLAEDRPFKECDVFDKRARTCSLLHATVWKKEFYKKKDRRFQGDYTRVPRGRIFEVDGQGFIVCVGSWINQYPQAKQQILDEFQLPNNTEFKIDTHWELGHGWSSDGY